MPFSKVHVVATIYQYYQLLATQHRATVPSIRHSQPQAAILKPMETERELC